MLFKRLKIWFFFGVLVYIPVYGDITIHILSPWSKDSVRSNTPVYIQSSECGWYPGVPMVSDFGGWLTYTFKTTKTTDNDHFQLMSVIPTTEDPLANRMNYTGGSNQIIFKTLFTGYETADEVWVIASDSTKAPQAQFTAPPCKVIRFFKPWEIGGAFVDIKTIGIFRMKGTGDYCGWLTYKYYTGSTKLSVRFRNTLDSTYCGSKGTGDATYIDLETVFLTSDTAWVLASPAGPPTIGAVFPNKLGDCSPIVLATKLRDKGRHPDFGTGACSSGRDPFKGLVRNRLDSDGKPAKSASNTCFSNRFGDWFRAETFDNGYTNEMCYNLILKRNDEGLYEYDTSDFFPLDSFKYLDAEHKILNPYDSIEGNNHNYLFTLETGAEFKYVPGQEFYFRGDDDVWVFIDSEIVVDLGGIHYPVEGSVDLDTLGLTPGKTYSFKLFFAERCAPGSSFKMVTSIALRTVSKLYYESSTLSQGKTRYDMYEKVTKSNMACDASELPIDTARATVEFYIEGPQFTVPLKLSSGVAYGGITVLSDYTGVIIDEPSITGLVEGDYQIHYYSTKDKSAEGVFKFTVAKKTDPPPPPPPPAKQWPDNPVKRAAYFSDNGFGAVDRAEIFFNDTLVAVPDSILFFWPSMQNRKLITTGIIVDPADKKHITVHFTDPFPKEITTFSAGNQLGRCYFYDTTYTAQPLLTIPFTIADSVGPLITAAVLIEKIEPGNDTMFLTFSEPLKFTALNGKSLVLFKNGQKIILNVLNAFPRGDSVVFVIEDHKENAPKVSDSIALNSEGPVVDLFGNTAHKQNRPVPLQLRRIPGKVINAYYQDEDADGIVDKAVLRFNKNITLTEITVSFFWKTTIKTGALNNQKFRYGKDSTEIQVNLSGLFSQQTIMTDGQMYVSYVSTIRTGEQTAEVTDSASPVITSAEIFPGNLQNGTKASDTLICTFSEDIQNIGCLNPFLFARAEQGRKTEYGMSLTVISGSAAKWVFIVDNVSGVEFPENKDSVWIHDSCGISDMPSNRQQNPLNHRVLLKVNTIPISYDIRVGPNPIYPSDPASEVTIKIEPSFKLKQFVNYHADVTIYDQLGNVVRKDHQESQNFPSLTVLVKWNGRNKKGRVVGYGTYLGILKITDILRGTEQIEYIRIGVSR